jgi:hypothetical protein
MFHYFNIPYITCTFFTKFTYNEYIGPYFLSHVVSKTFASAPPRVEHSGNMGWKAHEVAWNLYEIGLHFHEVSLPKE